MNLWKYTVQVCTTKTFGGPKLVTNHADHVVEKPTSSTFEV